MGHCCFVYLDDAISGLPQRISAIVACLVQIEWLKIEQEEIEFGAYVSGQWLGFVIDTIGMQQFRVPPKKIAKLKSNLNFMIMSRTATFRDLTRVAGFINSLLAAIPGRFIPLSKRGPAEMVRFLFLDLCYLSVYLSICWRPLTDTGFSQSSPSEQLFSAMPATTFPS
ncbi:unnamed protein product [Porites lobata]|uniref:Uncharacterized protein n=1 Tax=Porites lobata TaxID=104759 RepID=A0ABN8N2P6_9CNID|nr:unnamed protein product [Porites lobata]